MIGAGKSKAAWLLALTLLPALAGAAAGQTAQGIYHSVEGRVLVRNQPAVNVRVRLLRMPEMRPVTETFTRSEGRFEFKQLPTSEYAIETVETERYEATMTNVSLVPPDPRVPSTQHVMLIIDLPLKPVPGQPAPGVVAADLDTDVPRQAAKHFRSGMEAVSDKDSARALSEFEAALKIHPGYYAARLEMGRELRLQKRFREAEEVLRPLAQIAPKQATPRIERGIALLSLGRREEAAAELRAAVGLEETNWAAHLYLGWALLETDGAKAEPHLKRALELDEEKAARAHLALARLAQEKGQRDAALEHLDAYVALAPDSPDAEAARRLAARLRSPD
jgi:tetratricopeptide (TPR) repeat protein